MPKPDGQDLRHLVVVVSRDAVNRLMRVIGADVTSRERDRALPTAVAVGPTEETGPTKPSYVLCHELTTFVRGRLDSEPIGRLSPADLWRVERALEIVLGIAELPAG